ncbi:hypothetical protein [Nocardia transvalensis]|uniref:hypothetical protein n=1 Tax=Nocardia transvalensis TaxID=37333 RepID=UPI00189533D3|nr:hypothetical protein [Nocardia transvalensis]MBF6333529.1 hypothetical protein [Nocardia transvalensis]
MTPRHHRHHPAVGDDMDTPAGHMDGPPAETAGDMNVTPDGSRHPRRRQVVRVAAGVVAAGLLYAALHYCGAPGDRHPSTTSTSPTTGVTSPTAGPTSGGATSPSASPTGGVGSDADTPPPPAQTAAAVAVARAFAADLATPGVGFEDWWSRVARWTSPQLGDSLRHTDWRRVPASQVVTVTVRAAGPTVTDVEIVYDTSPSIGVRAERGPQGWWVTTALPMRTHY